MRQDGADGADGGVPFGDYIQPFQIEAPGLRGRLVRLGGALDSVLGAHGYPPPVQTILAESVAMTAVLASGLKYDGVFSLQIQGDGPISLLLVDLTSDGALRGYARFDEGRLNPVASASGSPVPRLLGAGHMAFTVDQGPDTDRYQGVTPLEGATLSECAHTYFRRSEQLQTAIQLSATDMGRSAPGRRAAALMIQRLPVGETDDFESEEQWRRAVVLMSSVTPQELLEPALAPDVLLYRLFHEDGVRIFRRRFLEHRCRCSREKVARTLQAFPRSEIEDLAEDGVVRVTCEFCKTLYTFDESDLDAVY